MRAAPPIDVRPLHELIESYTETVARPCLCGGVVIANPVDPSRELQRHQAEPRHAEWSKATYAEWQP